MDENDRQLLLAIDRKLNTVIELYERFKPLLERYEAAANAGSILSMRRALKQ